MGRPASPPERSRGAGWGLTRLSHFQRAAGPPCGGKKRNRAKKRGTGRGPRKKAGVWLRRTEKICLWEKTVYVTFGAWSLLTSRGLAFLCPFSQSELRKGRQALGLVRQGRSSENSAQKEENELTNGFSMAREEIYLLSRARESGGLCCQRADSFKYPLQNLSGKSKNKESFRKQYLLCRKWQPTPAFLPGKSHGQRRQVGNGPWGRQGSGMTEQ